MMTRKILKAKGLENTYFYEIIEKAFAVTFVFLRSFVCTWVVYNIWVSNMPFITKVAVSITYGVGLFWIYIIMGIAIKNTKKELSSPGIRALVDILGFIKKNQIFFSAFVVVWALILPFFLTYVVNTGFVHLKIRSFIVF
jgi:hypothetical protein